MVIQVHNKDYFPGYHSMRDLNGDASSSNWPFYYSDRTLTNEQYRNGFVSGPTIDSNPGYEKDVVKQRMIEHETVFKNQVSELHRLYRIQRDMMEEAKRRELKSLWMPMEPSSSSSIMGSQVPTEDPLQLHAACFPLANSSYVRPAASTTDIVNSPISCTNGNYIRSGRVPLQNGHSPKHSEVLDSRPSKVRKKLFDLELPPDNYIDIEEGEQLHDSEESLYPGDVKITQQSNVKMFLHARGETDCRKGTSTSALCARNVIELVDLNEPAQLEEATTRSPVDFLSHCTNHTNAKSSGFTGKPNPLSLVKAPDGLEQNKPYMHSHPAEGIQGRAQQHPGIYPTHGIKGDMWRQKTGCGLRTFEKSISNSDNSFVEPLATHAFSSSHPPFNSSEFSKSWSHSVSAWGKPSSSLTQKVTPFHKNPCLNSSTVMERQPTHSSIWDDRSGSSKVVNGFNHGSSGLRESSACFPSGFLNNLKNNRGDYKFPEQSSNHWYEKLRVSSNFVESKTTKVLDLNEAISKDDEELVDNKDKLADSASTLCWLRNKPVPKNMGNMPNSDFSSIQSSSYLQDNNLNHTNETLSERNIATKKVGETQCVKKILGVPILEIPFASKDESSSRISTSATIPSSAEGEFRNEKKPMIDINVACDISISDCDEKAVPESLVAEKGLDSERAGVRNQFDLNSCITEEDDALGSSVASNNVKTRAMLVIDLEAPVVLDSEDDNPSSIQENNQHESFSLLPEPKVEKEEDESTWIAADAIVALTSSQCIATEKTHNSPSEGPLSETLRWFVDVVSSFGDELNLNPGKEITDDFEMMILQLPETKEEEYMPKPFVPEAQNMENAGTHSVPRRGQARRGRQRRDFQRDILPSLISLSRHEVSEDFQTFGRLMSPRNCVLTRRNGSGRGRRRAVVVEAEACVVSSPVSTPLMQQLNKRGLEDKNLTGWGRTTRRPRRQRCPPAAVTPPPVPALT